MFFKVIKKLAGLVMLMALVAWIIQWDTGPDGPSIGTIFVGALVAYLIVNEVHDAVRKHRKAQRKRASKSMETCASATGSQLDAVIQSIEARESKYRVITIEESNTDAGHISLIVAALVNNGYTKILSDNWQDYTVVIFARDESWTPPSMPGPEQNP